MHRIGQRWNSISLCEALAAAAKVAHSPKGLMVDSTAAINPSSHPAPHNKPGSAAMSQCNFGIFPRFFRIANGSSIQGIELSPTPMPILAP